MTKKEFLEEIGVNPSSMHRFMKLKGPISGSQNSAYWGSLEFFKKRAAEQKAAKAEAAKENRKRKRDEVDGGNAVMAVANSPPLHPLANNETAQQVFTLRLDNYNVYDDCDEIRHKLALLIQSPGMNQTKVCKFLGCTGNSFNAFLIKKGSDQGIRYIQ